MPSLPEKLPDKLPGPIGGAPFFWGGAAWDWFVKSLQTIYLAVRAQQTPASQEDVLTALATVNKTLEKLVAQSDSFQGSLDRNTAATGAAGAAITAEIAQLKAAIDALSTTQAPTQAQLDQLNASSDALEAATASLVADDAAPTA